MLVFATRIFLYLQVATFMPSFKKDAAMITFNFNFLKMEPIWNLSRKSFTKFMFCLGLWPKMISHMRAFWAKPILSWWISIFWKLLKSDAKRETYSSGHHIEEKNLFADLIWGLLLWCFIPYPTRIYLIPSIHPICFSTTMLHPSQMSFLGQRYQLCCKNCIKQLIDDSAGQLD